MSLTEAQFKSIIRKYENKQILAHDRQSSRQEEIFRKLPAYAELDSKIAETARLNLFRMLDSDNADFTNTKEQIRLLSLKKKELLVSNGYPEDYLELKYECPDCQDTGYILGKKCHCFKKQEMDILYEQSNIKDSLKTNNFSALSYDYYKGEDLSRFENAVNVSHAFVDNFSLKYENLFFFGTVGTGKSFLSGCIAKELLDKGRSVIYFSSCGFFDTMSGYTFDHKQKEYLASFREDIYNCDLVIIDDLGTEVTNSFVTSTLFSLLNERHLRQKATIISTNLSLEELRDRYSDRVFSRITSHYSLCKLSGPDIRMMKKISGK